MARELTHYGFDQQDLLDDALRLLAAKETA